MINTSTKSLNKSLEQRSIQGADRVVNKNLFHNSMPKPKSECYEQDVQDGLIDMNKKEIEVAGDFG